MFQSTLRSSFVLIASLTLGCRSQAQSDTNGLPFAFHEAVQKVADNDPKIASSGFEELRGLARNGDVDAMLEVSDCYLTERATRKDAKKAYNAVRIAAEKGSAEGLYRMSKFLIDGTGIKKNESLGKTKLRQAAELNHKSAVSAMCFEAVQRYSRNGKGEREVRKWSERGIALEIATCYWALGSCYQNGIGVEIDLDKAFGLFDKGAGMKDEDCMVCLAQCYIEGKVRKADELKALQLLAGAAQGSNAYAIYEYARNLDKLIVKRGDDRSTLDPLNFGIGTNPQLALQKYQREVMTQLDRAIALGCPYAMNLQAEKLSIGDGCNSNLAAAFQLAGASWKLKDMDGACLLAKFYREGIGVSKNPKRAASLYAEAAKKGLPQAQFEYGVCLANGNGVRMNAAEGQRWIARSAQNGNQSALQYLNEQAQREMPVLGGWRPMSPEEAMIENHIQSQIDEYIQDQERSSQFMRDRDGY